ncbi:MAG TPA: hypothetical protein VF275_06735 [Gammaproteobacteria bacterium]
MIKKNILKVLMVALAVSLFATVINFYLSSTFLTDDEVLTGLAAGKRMIASFGWAAYIRSFVAMWVFNLVQVVAASLLLLTWMRKS